MKLIKAETDIKPIPNPELNITMEDYIEEYGFALRFRVKTIKSTTSLPNSSVFNSKPRSYIFGLIFEGENWFQVKFDDANADEIVFDLPGEAVNKIIKSDNPKLSVFMGYNEGFLGATFKDGFFSPKERVLYWYCLARTRIDCSLSDYFVYGYEENFPLVINIESLLSQPSVNIKKTLTIGSPDLKIGGGWHFGDSYNG